MKPAKLLRVDHETFAVLVFAQEKSGQVMRSKDAHFNFAVGLVARSKDGGMGHGCL